MEKLPDLDHLRAFEAAARHLSFKDAAEELNVTAAAVGQRIRSLETQLGRDLFVRKPRRVFLTPHGEALAASVSIGLDAIRAGLRQLRDTKAITTLTVSTTHSFAEMCLLPRLPEFTEANPECDVRLISTHKRIDMDAENIDVSVRYGRTPTDECEHQLFAEEDYILVCAPKLLESNGPIELPSDVSKYALIETRWPVEPAAAPTWDHWFQLHGLIAPRIINRISVSLEAHAVRAAIGGQGIALCHQAYADIELENGRLVRLLDNVEKLQPSFRHHLVWRKDADTVHAKKFRAWLVKRCGTGER